MRPIYSALIQFLILSVGLAAERSEPISGRVFDDSGRPIPRAVVRLTVPGGLPSSKQSAYSDVEGSFRFKGLAPGSYRLHAQTAGYVQVASDGAMGEDRFYHPGEVADLTLTKGGVITGMVTDGSGQPVAEVWVWAIPVGKRGSERFLGEQDPITAITGRMTDDRGVYRLFGLEAGSYLVSAGGRMGDRGMSAPHDDATPCFFSADGSGRPSEVRVTPGTEVSGVNIRLRALQGFAISGSVTSTPGSDIDLNRIMVMLIRPGTESIENFAVVSKEDSGFHFSIENIGAGDFRLIAKSVDEHGQVSLSRPLSVKVRGQDVSGITSRLAPLPSVSGQIHLAEEAKHTLNRSCPPGRRFVSEEFVIAARRISPAGREAHWDLLFPEVVFGSLDKKGEFTFRALAPGVHRIQVRPPSPDWYVQSMTLPANASGGVAFDVASQGLPVNPGERLPKLKVVIAPGAARLRGHVLSQPEAIQLPQQLGLHLVPAEREQASNLLRFIEAQINEDGTFEMVNIPPGRYWLLARTRDANAQGIDPGTIAWDQDARTRLLLEAQQANQLIDLPLCGRVQGYRLSYSVAPPN